MKTLLESIRLDPFLQELFTSTKTSGPKYITGKDDAPWQAEDHFQLKDWSHQFHFSFFSQTKTSRLMYIAGKEAGPCAMRMAEDHLQLTSVRACSCLDRIGPKSCSCNVLSSDHHIPNNLWKYVVTVNFLNFYVNNSSTKANFRKEFQN